MLDEGRTLRLKRIGRFLVTLMNGKVAGGKQVSNVL